MHVISGVQVTNVDATVDVVRGIAEPGARLELMGWNSDNVPCSRTVFADSAGSWAADFSQPEEATPESCTLDVSAETHGNVQVPDQDDDMTAIQWDGLSVTLTPDTAVVSVNEGEEAINTISVTGPAANAIVLTSSQGTLTRTGTDTWAWQYTPADGPADDQQITVQAIYVDTGDVVAQTGFDLVVENLPPQVADIVAPAESVVVGSGIQVTAEFVDPGTSDLHTAVWDWGDGSTAGGAVQENNGTGLVSGEHAYSSPGVYTLQLIVTDDDGGSGQTTYRYVVVYDANGPFTTGAGWVSSPEGAYTANPEFVGRAKFGINAKYKPGEVTPQGHVKFWLEDDDFDFDGDEYDWLFVIGNTVYCQGSGTLNGVAGYNFRITAIDSDLEDAGDIASDRFRIVIWTTDVEGNRTTVYDSGVDVVPFPTDTASGTVPLQNGAVQIHQP